MALFGYDENVMSGILRGLVKTILTMGTDVEKYESTAEKLEVEAAEKEKYAGDKESEASLIDLNPQKDVQDYTTDEKGNQVPDGTHKETDEAQKATNIARRDSLLQKAAQAKKEAANNRANAAQLRRLAAGLRLLKGDVEAAQKNFQLAADNTKKAVTESTNLLVAGASMIGKVISVFNVPEAKNVGDWAKGFGNNVLKTFLGVDLSDGIDTDEVNKIAGIVVDTAATVVSGFTSIVVSSLVASTPIGGTGLASLAGVTARGGTNFLLNLGRDTAAKAVSKNFVSGLNFLGIKVKEPEKKEDETKVDTDGVNEALEGKKNEMGTLEDATKKNAEEGGNVVGTIASEEVITGNTVQVNDTTEPNPPPKKTEYELAQEQYEKANTEYNNYVNSHKAEKTRVGNSREVYQDEVTRLKNEREKTIQDNLRLSHAANSNIDSGSLKQINNLIEENKKKISEYTEGISKNQALYNEANSKYQKISTEESRLRQQLTNAQTKKNQYNPNK